jgi:hypothetical protein
MLVMIPREPDPKVRHDGRIPARKHADAGVFNTVNERGHMHGASRIHPARAEDIERETSANDAQFKEHHDETTCQKQADYTGKIKGRLSGRPKCFSAHRNLERHGALLGPERETAGRFRPCFRETAGA